ncbi:MAG: anti-sigma factor [Chloroflexota bacterium]
MNDHDGEQVGAYVLDALSPEEKDAFEEHLRDCATCESEVMELRQVVSVLPLAADSIEPSSHLKTRILASIADEETQRPSLTLMKGSAQPTRRRPGLRAGSGLIGIAAALLIAALGVWNINLQQNSNDNARRVALAEEVSKAELDHPAVAVMPGQGLAQGASAKVIVPQHGNSVYMLVTGLPSAPSGKIYQLWVMRGGSASTPVSAGVFSAGGSVQYVKMARPKAGYPLTALTVEPAPNGSKAPTTPPVMIGKFTA